VNETLDAVLDDKVGASMPSKLGELKSALTSHYDGNLRGLKIKDNRLVPFAGNMNRAGEPYTGDGG
jgi:hypothetical protein